jgi:hypothetical protein
MLLPLLLAAGIEVVYRYRSLDSKFEAVAKLVAPAARQGVTTDCTFGVGSFLVIVVVVSRRRWTGHPNTLLQSKMTLSL